MIENTIRHNLESMNPDIAPLRAIGLLGPLLGIDQVIHNRSTQRVLIIGPRTEAEILWYISKGFDQNNIIGLDLFSYSQYIQTGDMHSLPYPDSSFDIIVFSWVLGYSCNQKLAVSEAIRVVRSYGLIAIGEQWDPTPISETSAMMMKVRGYSLEGTETKQSSDLLDLFSGTNLEVLFRTEPLESQKSRIGLISIITKIVKDQ